MPGLNTSFVTYALAAAISLGTLPANAEKVLYAFKGGNDGLAPGGKLISDNAGNLYGTTGGGGGGTGCNNGSNGCGTVFKLAPAGTETVLYAFQGGSDGAFPSAGVIADGAGNFYGTTQEGGANNRGAVFRLAPNGTQSVLYSFQGGSDGFDPAGALIVDNAGNLYGMTVFGGNFNGSDCTDNGCGTVFELRPDGTKVTLYAFQGGNDGWFAFGPLIADNAGNLYGTTVEGVDTNCANGSFGCGIVFKLAPDGTETVLHAFQSGSDGTFPASGLLADSTGNFYGTTEYGGSTGCGGFGCGTVFKVTPNGTESVLYSFKGGTDGFVPQAGLVMDKAGNLYGTTAFGGGNNCTRVGGCGLVFKLAPDGTETVLFNFNVNRKRGKNPTAALLKGPNGILYGTTGAGGDYNDGVVFSVKK